jgi:ATP sulfurylase
MDGECADNGAYAEMVKKEVGDKDPHHPMAKKMCTAKYAKAGGKYVLYKATAKKVYALGEQTKPEQFAGQKVKVTGSFDTATDPIHVTNISPGS